MSKRKRIWTIIGILAFAASILWLSYCLKDQEWASNALTGVGVTALLVIPVGWYSERHRELFSKTQKSAQEAAASAQKAVEVSHDAQRQVGQLKEEIEQLLAQRKKDKISDELSILETWDAERTFKATRDALEFLTQQNILTDFGYTVSVTEMDVYLRLQLSPEGVLRFSFLGSKGEQLGEYLWTEEVSHEVAYSAVEDLIEKVDVVPSRHWVMITNTLDKMIYSLTEALQRTMVPIEHGIDYLRIIGYSGYSAESDEGAWYMTCSVMFPKAHSSYRIEAERINEMDWETHVNPRPYGSGFSPALKQAKALWALKVTESS